ncbi:hypothetical protein BV20DRAFT_1039723 [Pilatotrama ljubarskyi]|nr:hypothetical protein BV20DRAFT_1039723 [Pilatotrama ljubarskyi]
MSQSENPDDYTGMGDDIYAHLSPVEIFWRNRQPFFMSHGYTLRPRYRPGWEPSWKLNPDLKVYDAEDHLGMHMMRPHLMDARRISDNKLVQLKQVRSDSREVQITAFLSSPTLREDPRNHSVPILDVLRDPEDDKWTYLVMPYLRYIDNPRFETVGDILQCCDQLLEGLVFLHEHGIAHRDCTYRNIMMDAEALYPQGFHPMSEVCLPNSINQATSVLSRRAASVKYYYVDFGISSHFAPDEANRLVVGTSGLDQEVPELSEDVPYDPFKVDVFILGNMFWRFFIDKFTNLNMLGPLVYEMINPNPAERPTAVEALRLWEKLRRDVFPKLSVSEDYIKDRFAKLAPIEVFWRNRQPFLQAHGYTLRSRYRPGWIPSWRRDPAVDVFKAEDHLTCHPFRPNLMDARRISDGKLVQLKRVPNDSHELEIATFLSSSRLREDPRNHSVPLLDSLQDPEDPGYTYMVMPYLRYIDNPPFDTIQSIIDCVTQLLEGLAFLHEHGVAHRDCAFKNVMMDAEALFPRGFHPMAEVSLPQQINVLAPTLPRWRARPTYYFVDFGISTKFSPSDTNKLVLGRDGLDQEVPELSDDIPYDPFKVDIFILGNLFAKEFVLKYKNMGVLLPLVRAMINPDPALRPTAAEALRQWQEAVRNASYIELLYQYGRIWQGAFM